MRAEPMLNHHRIKYGFKPDNITPVKIEPLSTKATLFEDV
jgi:hypothetical protein